MSDAPSLPAMRSESSEPLTAETDYSQIADALMQTQRGRRFLAEHSRRCRQIQQADLLAALARLERAIAIDHEPPGVTKLRSDLAALTRAVERVRAEVAALRPTAPPARLRPKDDETVRPLRESPAPPASAPQPAVKTSDSRDKLGNGQEPHEKAAVPARNGAADGPAGEPCGADGRRGRSISRGGRVG